MIIDSSALFAILLQEPEAERIARTITRNKDVANSTFVDGFQCFLNRC